MGMPTTSAVRIASAASFSVLGSRFRISLPTRNSWRSDLPRSPRTKSEIQKPYCTGRERWRLSSRRSSSACEGDISLVRAITSGSPGLSRMKAKTMTVTSRKTGIAISSRLAM